MSHQKKPAHLREKADSGTEAGNMLGEPGTSCHTKEQEPYQIRLDPVKRTQDSTYGAPNGERRNNLSFRKDSNYRGWKTLNVFTHIISSLKKKHLVHFCKTIGNLIILQNSLS